MKIILDGKINRLYVQSLCMLFFRGEKFPENEENPRGILEVKLTENADGVGVQAHLIYDENEASEYAFEKFNSKVSFDRTVKTAVGKAVYSVGNKLTGRTVPWGILTGIRPSKVASELLEYMNEDEAIDTLKEQYLLSYDKAKLCVDVANNENSILRRYDDSTCSVYISIPFCPTRCSYCSFISYATKKLFDLIPDYVSRLIEEIDNTFKIIDSLKLKVVSVYIGGGTPTMLSLDYLEKILSHLSKKLKGREIAEFTVEGGRPDTITEEKLSVLSKYGVDRISINPQSLNDSVLKSIGRNHTVKDFYDAYNIAAKSGIKDINTDLIAGLDGDSFESFKDTVDSIVELSPSNVTVHSFSVKKSARILTENKDIYNQNEDYALVSVDYAYKTLTENGYIPYYMYRQKNTVSDLENVGYAKAGTFGLYNVLMMGDGHTVFGIGAGATTKLVKRINNKTEILRIFYPKYPYEYLQDNQSKDDEIFNFYK